MLFNSYQFIFIFLPISFFVYFYLNKKRLSIASKGWLIITSLFFYSWWNIAYLPLILVSILFNYAISNMMMKQDETRKNYFSKKALLQIGLIFNVGLLAYYKYMDFFISTINTIVSSDIKLLHIALPLAISFYTLQQIAFLVDSYRGLVREKNFLDYTIFVTFFPQLIAGPIVHHKEMMPQFTSTKNKILNYENIALGLFIFSIGLFKKVVIADTFAVWATAGFDTATTLNFFEAWATSLSYTFQLYFDFSGYTDMAIGIALFFNIILPINFNSPYKALNLQDLWKRWHITLTRFITSYIYNPLTMSFKKITIAKALFTTFITFLIVGMWHGASWLFIFWGGLHGIGLVVNYYWQKKSKFKINIFWAWFLTFNYFSLLLVFFRAKDLDQAIKVLKGMFGFGDPIALHGITFDILTAHTNIDLLGILFIIGGFIVTVLFPNSNDMLKRFKANIFTLLFSIFLFIYSILNINKYSEFLYFNF